MEELENWNTWIDFYLENQTFDGASIKEKFEISFQKKWQWNNTYRIFKTELSKYITMKI